MAYSNRVSLLGPPDFLVSLQVIFTKPFGLFALGLVEAVNEIDLFAVGSHDERRTVGELHGRGLRVIERRPVRQPLAVEVARLGQFHFVFSTFFPSFT